MQTLTPLAERKDIPFAEIMRKASEDYRVPISGLEITVQDGNGVHTHEPACDFGQVPEWGGFPCMRHCDDSDWIVTVVYDGYHEAVYGVLNGVPELWAD